ncbi:MFS transporter [Pigmentiphaga litoralis]|uniref:Putative MFS family arabinose efflux permease n=1 Tax=Pigmentiphaga litoralis TaxID=516702 RepID=A0A7Y9IUI1_9BURK|nr:MFS transporter [Pigmentiphaga litoralis]NYE23098.1 putative MFS family arabinose efflux permease [Pigmentiphaga litoralis]NYE83287.1 putative MFS family arabinose efflux permease [Pigmentiphaga litoralis]
MPPSDNNSAGLTRRQSIFIFACFAIAYFCSYGLRSVNAVLAPYITQDLKLNTSQLGWLSSAFFVSLAVMQAPLGVWLDRYGARRVESSLLLVAAIGSFVLVTADGFALTSLGRALIGCGVAASLMAPFSYFRRCYPADRQPQLALWILVAGTGGAVFFTTPAAALAAAWGWRSVHLASGISLAVIAALLWRFVPDADVQRLPAGQAPEDVSLRRLLRHPVILRAMPLAAVGQGSIIALQTLWAGPWMTDVLGMSASDSATALLWSMVAMMTGYVGMSVLSPPLQRRFGLTPIALVGYVICISAIFLIALLPLRGAWVLWLVVGVGVAPIMLMQPALAMQFPKEAAGRLVTLYNMFVFVGAFIAQWSVGLVVDLLRETGLSRPHAFMLTLGGVAILQTAAFVWFLYQERMARRNAAC